MWWNVVVEKTGQTCFSLCFPAEEHEEHHNCCHPREANAPRRLLTPLKQPHGHQKTQSNIRSKRSSKHSRFHATDAITISTAHENTYENTVYAHSVVFNPLCSSSTLHHPFPTPPIQLLPHPWCSQMKQPCSVPWHT